MTKVPPINKHPFDQSEVSDSDPEEFCQLYAVFCTSDIPAVRLNEFLNSVRKFCPPTTGTVLRILSSPSDLSTSREHPRQVGGTRPPVPAFETSFKGYSISDLRAAFDAGIAETEDRWADTCFAVLDERFLEDNTTLLVTAELPDPDEDDEQILDHRCEAEITLNLLLHYEMNRLGIDWHDANSDDWNLVITKEDYEVMMVGQPQSEP